MPPRDEGIEDSRSQCEADPVSAPAAQEEPATKSLASDARSPATAAAGVEVVAGPATDLSAAEASAVSETNPGTTAGEKAAPWRKFAPEILVTIVDWILFLLKHPIVAILLAITAGVYLSFEGPLKDVLQSWEKDVAIVLVLEKDPPRNDDLPQVNGIPVALLGKSRWKGGADWQATGEFYTDIKGTDPGTLILDDHFRAHFMTLTNFTESFDTTITETSSPTVISWIPRIQPKWSLPLLRGSPWRDKYYLLILNIQPTVAADGKRITTMATLSLLQKDGGVTTNEWEGSPIKFVSTYKDCELGITIFTKAHEHRDVLHEVSEADFDVRFTKLQSLPGQDSVCNEDAGIPIEGGDHHLPDSNSSKLTSGTIGFAMPTASGHEQIRNVFLDKNDDAKDEKPDAKPNEKQ